MARLAHSDRSGIDDQGPFGLLGRAVEVESLLPDGFHKPTLPLHLLVLDGGVRKLGEGEVLLVLFFVLAALLGVFSRP